MTYWQKHIPNNVQRGDEHEEAFRTLKNLLCNQLISQLPDTENKFILRPDASKEGLGAVVLQEHNEEVFPVCYRSCAFKAAERNYSTIKKECLVVVDGIKKYLLLSYSHKDLIICHWKTSDLWKLQVPDSLDRFSSLINVISQLSTSVDRKCGSQLVYYIARNIKWSGLYI